MALRVLVVLHDMSLTGAPRLALSTFRQLSDQVQVAVISGAGGPLERDFRRLGRVDVLRGGRLIDWVERVSGRGILRSIVVRVHAALIARMRLSILDRRPPDVLFVNSVAALPVLAGLSTFGRSRPPVLLYVHEGAIALDGYELMAPGLLDRNVDLVVAVSHVAAKALAEMYGFDESRIAVIQPHVDPEILGSGCGSRVDAAQPEPNQPTVIGGVGALSWIKGIDLWMLVAAELVRREGRDRYRFIWVGAEDGAARQTLLAMVGKLGLEGLVTIVPPTSDPLRIYCEMDILLVSSWEESASLVAMELVALEKQVAYFLGTGGPSELLGHSGIEVSRFSPVDMADAIQRATSNPTETPPRTDGTEVADRRQAGALARRMLDEIEAAAGGGRTPLLRDR